ncbi:ADP-ribosylation/Crystallin J1 [Gongronella butleri]|nr:ADP-ribosylation/Crystallin J1 [Gongronella butleri]
MIVAPPGGPLCLCNHLCSRDIKSVHFLCLHSGAVLGDSLGLATEGMTRDEVVNIYGKGPIRFGLEDEKGVPFHRDAYRACFDENDFGGDAEQQLLVIQTILGHGVFNYKEYAKLLQVYSKEGIPGLDKKPVGMNKTSQIVIDHPDFQSNPVKAAASVWQHTNTFRGANGALVRAAILGVPKFWDVTTVIESTADCCRITHPDPRCMISCVIVSTLVSRILRGQDLEKEDYAVKARAPLHTMATTAPSLPPTPTTDTLQIDKAHKDAPTPLDHNEKDFEFSPNASHIHLTPPPVSPIALKRVKHQQEPPLHKREEKDPSTTAFQEATITVASSEADPTMLAIVHNVIETNKRILTDPNTDPLFTTPETNFDQTRHYYQELLDYCYFFEDTPNVAFQSLQLDALENSRHIFKCLGAGILAFTRRIDPGKETEAFKTIIMDLVMQGGEADTNATVAGALLGLRIGYNHLPTEWVVGLQRWEWLEDLVEDFCKML